MYGKMQGLTEIIPLRSPQLSEDFPGGTAVKNPLANAGEAGDSGSIHVSGRHPGVGNGNPFQYSCLETRGAQGMIGHGVTELDTNEASQHTSYIMYKN